MIVRSAAAVSGGRVTGELVKSVVEEHLNACGRLRRLKAYYLGETDVLKRKRAPGLPNNRVAHAFARYIVTVTTGYLVGEGVGYQTDEENREGLSRVTDAYRACDIGCADVENARNAAIYGKGVELIWKQPGEKLPRAYPLSPENAFVVYADDIRHMPLFGVYMTRNASGEIRVLTVTDREKTEFVQRENGFVPIAREDHFFDGVPMVEYWNDENERGDFEWVMPLIDAYDALQSDRLNDKDQFADKLLVLTGCTLDTDEEGRPPWLQLRMDKALCLPDGDASARYLSGEMNESGNEILRSSLSEDIHKLSMVPDLSDKSFAGDLSGVAIRYKLLGLEQLAAMKQQWFTEGLKSRMRIYAAFLHLCGGPETDVSRVSAVYTRGLPENPLETAQIIRTAREAGAMSTGTMVEMLHKNGEWSEERLAREAEAARREKEEIR